MNEAEITMADVFSWLERGRSQNAARGYQTYWLNSAIADLRADKPDKALDCLSFVHGDYTHDEYMENHAEFEEAKRLLEFLEKRYSREGQIHNCDRR